MSEKGKFNPSSKVVELPDGGEVYDANWKDDIDLTPLDDDEFNATQASIKHGKRAAWNDFQAMGTSNRAEGEYIPPKEAENVDLEAILGKAKAIKFAKTIIGSYDKLENELVNSAAA